ncbi:hypothetical protein SAMN05443244_0432 [Terriglobus roseus]|uniref:Uncharacterized protein n=1 Tax=Terriglobus roseus TaxID=392734 RepID=A0A1H4J7W5_9BACT|nr:hypothetical protein SAMN05443244_0432 [Terriglobus roseus]
MGRHLCRPIVYCLGMGRKATKKKWIYPIDNKQVKCKSGMLMRRFSSSVENNFKDLLTTIR